MISSTNRSRSRFETSAIAAVLVLAVSAGVASAAEVYARFKSETETAMDRMMAGMAIKPSGNVDRDFAGMMTAHHQGAIEMAQAELRHGANESLRRIAQEIIVDQQQEIAAMRLAIGGPLPAPAPTDRAPAFSHPSTPSNPEHDR
jgi:uncharacterized protein (DUF305 family)